MKILIIDNNTKYLNYLQKLLGSNVVETITSKDLDTKVIEEYDLLILTGASKTLPVEINTSLNKEIEIVKNSNKAIIGICYGCEIIAKAFNCKFSESLIQIKGNSKVQILKSDKIFKDIKDFEVYENHRFSITNLSPEIEALAKSDFGYEIIKHKTKEIYGFQFHPEMYVNKDQGDEILLNTVKQIEGNSHQKVKCNFCGNYDELVWIHGHGQCKNCKTNIDECCRGETCDVSK